MPTELYSFEQQHFTGEQQIVQEIAESQGCHHQEWFTKVSEGYNASMVRVKCYESKE
jgi:hypothetical protein